MQVCRVAHEMRTRTSRAAAVPHAVAGSSRAGGQAAVAGPQDDHKVAPRPEGESEGKEVESVAKLAHDGGAAGPQPPRMTSSGSRGLKAASEPKPRQVKPDCMEASQCIQQVADMWPFNNTASVCYPGA